MRLLYNRKKVEEKLTVAKKQTTEEELNSDEILYNNICKLMEDKHLYKDPLLKRDNLAASLNTNRTYLSEAVHKYADGITFSEFVNRYRLHHAANLLTNNPNLSIYDVAEQSGFNSRSTYNRLFRDYYGMSSSEFRSIAKEKKKG